MFNVRSVSVYRLLIVYRKNDTKIANKGNKKRSKFAKKSERVQKIHNGSLATVYAILTVRNGNYCLSGKAEKSVEKKLHHLHVCAPRGELTVISRLLVRVTRFATRRDEQLFPRRATNVS